MTLSLPTVRHATADDVVAIRQIAEEWPEYFTNVGITAIVEDACKHRCMVAEVGIEIVSFIVWVYSHVELQLLWIATDRARTRQGLARMLVEAVEATATTQRVIYLKTASVDSLLAMSTIDGRAFSTSHAFWEKIGYEGTSQIPSFWDFHNHCVIFVKRLWREDVGL